MQYLLNDFKASEISRDYLLKIIFSQNNIDDLKYANLFDFFISLKGAVLNLQDCKINKKLI